jgi:carbamoylphosphate synthase large subunit
MTAATADVPRLTLSPWATRRVAFLRSIEIGQAAPYLEPLRGAFADRGIDAQLFFTDGEMADEYWPAPAERISPDTEPAELTRRLLAWGVDGVVSLSIPDENAIRDAIVAEQLAVHGVASVMHSVETTECLSNKWQTKLALREHGLLTPEGVLVDGDLVNGRCLPVPAYPAALTRHVRRIGFPLLSKPLWDCLANGIHFIGDEADWQAYLASPYEGNTVLERCVEGELCSVEIIGADGHYVLQPLIWKGRTGGAPTFVFSQLRYAAPRPSADRAFEEVSQRLVQLCRQLDVRGAVEVEMIYSGGKYWIIEINPRVSGSTGLSIAASGRNTYLCLLDMLIGDWPNWLDAPTAPRLACQLPLATMDDPALDAARSELDVVRANDFTIDGVRYANMVIACEEADRLRVSAALHHLSARYGLLSPAVLAEITELLAGHLPPERAHRP